jgi:AbiV family abortive infection protein
MGDPRSRKKTQPYSGGLTPAQASSAIQAARLAALELADSAKILFNLKRFAHSSAFSTLAIEEFAKRELIQRIFLGFAEDDRPSLWKAYRQHRAKTSSLNPGIEGRIRANFPDMDPAEARKIGELGPTPEDLEIAKQRAIYSDCLQASSGLFIHCPVAVEWREIAWERLCEAKALAASMRDYPPDELEIWLKHAKEAQQKGTDVKSMLRPLHEELLERGFIKEGQWRVVMTELERDEE